MANSDSVVLSDFVKKLLCRVDAPSGMPPGSSFGLLMACRNMVHKGDRLCVLTLALSNPMVVGSYGSLEIYLPADAVNDQSVKQLLGSFGASSSKAEYTDEQPFPHRADYIRGYVKAIEDLARARGGEKVGNLRFSYEEMRLAGVDPRSIAAVKDWLKQS